MAGPTDRIKNKGLEMTLTGNPTSTKRRNRDTYEQDDDGNSNNDPNANGPPAKKIKQCCRFCLRDTKGRQMAQVRACNYETLANGDILECQNCADYRSEHPETELKCEPHELLRNKKVWRRYGIKDPSTYPAQPCDQCITSGKSNQCNVDSILNYGCTATKACREGRCTLNGHRLEAAPSSVISPDGPWTRRECQYCEHLTTNGRITIGCSWLRDRANRNEACFNCQSRNLACFNGGRLIAEPQTFAKPQALTLPKVWNVSATHEFGFVDCRKTGTTRRTCKRCLEDKHGHCHADAGSYRYACTRCAELGVDCVDSGNDTYYPIFDLARVGIGLHLPFIQCSCCIKKGRNCDLQRPCDSCVEHGDQCDAFAGDTARYCINGRLDPPPGPLYYLALGYGANGVNDVKDGSAVEHWVGPLTSIYGMIPGRDNRQLVASFAADLRGKLFPHGEPPHGDVAQNGVMFGPASAITKENIVAWIESKFPQHHPITEYEGYTDYIQAAKSFVQNLRSGRPRLRVEQFLSSEPRSFTHGPDCGEHCCVDVAGNVAAHNLAVSAIVSPVPVSAQVPIPFLNDNAMDFLPMPMDIDGNDTINATGYIYENQNENENENAMCQGAGALQLLNSQWPNPHFDFTIAAPSDQELPAVRFSPDLPVDMDLGFGLNIYPSPYVPAARLYPPQAASSNFHTDLDSFLGFSSNHFPVGELDIRTDIDLSLLAGLEINPPEILVDEEDREANIDPRLRTEFVDFNPLPFDNPNTDPRIDPEQTRRDIALCMTIFGDMTSQSDQMEQNPKNVAFGIAHDKINGEPSGFNNVLKDIPRRAKHVAPCTPNKCLELRDAQFCEYKVTADSICQSGSHVKEDRVHVCDHCSKESALELVSIGSSFDLAAIENMRAYLCNHCAEKVSKDVRPVLRNRLTSDLKVWGKCQDFPLASRIPVPFNKEGGTITFMGDAQKITGCLCGTKLLYRRLCYSHRLKYGDEVVKQAQEMQDWCQQKYGAKTCFVCLKGSQPRVVAFKGRQWAANQAKCTAWQCLVCGDLVLNQPTMSIFGPQGPKAIVSIPRVSINDVYEIQDGEEQETEHDVQEISSEELMGEEELRSYATGGQVSFGEPSPAVTYLDEESNGIQEGTLYEQIHDQNMELFEEQAEAKNGDRDGRRNVRGEQAQKQDTSESNEEAAWGGSWTLVHRPI
ncbi:hypothetical protein THAR02_10478 [Trichoderma harzianum]|uniref:Uncharacterized protein n=1 Tax=Trichoderma harzianum TaxID=5544 RepID=A0A0F9WY80_TRIHA|nr:hypothetical protein THAR02_10478 [Trichoderma harzianum]